MENPQLKNKTDIVYDFSWSNGDKKQFTISLNPETGEFEGPATEVAPWTKLDYNKCSHCPLNSTDTPQCPVARNLGRVVDSFVFFKSYDNIHVEVQTTERTYYKETSIQVALQSILGLMMATSGCPFLKFLRPMARFHLPFSSYEETLVRSLSFYLLGQYFKGQKGNTPDWQLDGLEKAYQNLSEVNQGLANRISSMKSDFISESGDAAPNAIVILDGFAQLLSMDIKSEYSSIAEIFLK